MQETIRLQDIFLQLSRGVNCCRVQFWFPWPFGTTSECNVRQEEVVQAFLIQACRVCVNLPACLHNLDVHKAWFFAATLEALSSMGGKCNHPQGSHQSIVGTRDEHGNFQSKQTAQYPKALAETFAKIVGQLVLSYLDLGGTNFFRGYEMPPTEDNVGTTSSLSRRRWPIFISRLVLSKNSSYRPVQRTEEVLFRYDSAE